MFSVEAEPKGNIKEVVFQGILLKAQKLSFEIEHLEDLGKFILPEQMETLKIKRIGQEETTRMGNNL